jgi:hypothetical protein
MEYKQGARTSLLILFAVAQPKCPRVPTQQRFDPGAYTLLQAGVQTTYLHYNPLPFNVPQRSLMYVTVSCRFLKTFVISVYCTGLGGQCGKKNLLHCAPSLSPKAELWALKAHVHNNLWISDCFTALYVMFLMQANPLLGQVGGGWALEISPFFWLQMALA